MVDGDRGAPRPRSTAVRQNLRGMRLLLPVLLHAELGSHASSREAKRGRSCWACIELADLDQVLYVLKGKRFTVIILRLPILQASSE